MVYYTDTTCKKDTISVSSLKKIIEPYRNSKSVTRSKLYVTSRKSGTLRKYQETLGVNFDSISNTLYYETDSLEENDVAIVLGSKFYKPRIKSSKWSYVVDEKGDTIKKPLYVFFVAFKNDKFKPHKQIVDFFEHTLDVKNIDEKCQRDTRANLLFYLN